MSYIYIYIYIYIYVCIFMEHLFLMFLDHTQWHSTVGRTPLDEWSARRRDLYLTTHDTHDRQISMPPVGFEPTISAGERPQVRPDRPRPTTLLPPRFNGKPESATAVYKLLMLGMRMAETCWAVFKRRAINLRDWCIRLVWFIWMYDDARTYKTLKAVIISQYSETASRLNPVPDCLTVHKVSKWSGLFPLHTAPNCLLLVLWNNTFISALPISCHFMPSLKMWDHILLSSYLIVETIQEIWNENQLMSLFYSYIAGCLHVSGPQAHLQETSYSCSHNHWFSICAALFACSVCCGLSWWQHTEHANRAAQILNQWLCEQPYELSWRWACGPKTFRDPAIYE